MKLQSRPVRETRASVLAALCGALVLALAQLPQPAYARSYEITGADIDATIEADGGLAVTETRTFDFDGDYHGVYWKIPTGSYEGREIETSITGVGEYVDGQLVMFDRAESGDEHTYMLTDHPTYVEVKLYSAHSDEDAQFSISYHDTNLAARYDDISELYWKFASDGWDVETDKITCRVHLPVPDGATVTAGENVRAWGHGPLDATVGFDGNDVVYQVLGLGTTEFAEARITFPSEWLSAASSLGGSHLDSILAEERAWADEANAKREQARFKIHAAEGILTLIPLLVIGFALHSFIGYRRTHKALFDDKYFRDVPSEDHPAVLGTLLNDGEVTAECVTASLMHLTDEGHADLELVKYQTKGLLGRNKTAEGYRLTPRKWPKKGGSQAARIDQAMMDFLFRKLSVQAAGCSKREGASSDELFFDEIERVARKYPGHYSSCYERWEHVITDECKERGFFADQHDDKRDWLFSLAAICGILAIVALILLLILDVAPLALIGIPALCALAALISWLVYTQVDPVSPEAIELVAKLKALRNWLKDFTRLEEAIPQDVVLWDRLLVMAVVLGVADEVIDQLKMAAPQILEDPRMAPVYLWYRDDGPVRPASSFTSSASEAHSVSTSKLAGTSDSSGSGSGGGFSSGGGGGFGGGGGGGAF